MNDSDTAGKTHQGEQTYYVYNSAGDRVRKTTLSANGVKLHETLYVGGYEVYRRYASAGNPTLERHTLHVMDDKQRVALVETVTINEKVPPSTLPITAIRYQFGNHLGTACLELDETGAVITYEEYYPYGGTSYQAGRSIAEASLKRYRYTAKECDKETGLYYHGARYYAPWIGRWTSCDPKGLINRFEYGAIILSHFWILTTVSHAKDNPAAASVCKTYCERRIDQRPDRRHTRNCASNICRRMRSRERAESLEAPSRFSEG